MICIPVVAATQSEALQFIERAAKLADVLELRMDLLSDGNVKELIEAAHSFSTRLKVLVTNRIMEASTPRDEKKRIGVLLDAVALDADFVDLELFTALPWIETVRAAIAARHNRTALIISHHDFRKTPSRRTLNRYFEDSVATGANVVKIVTLAKTPADNLPVLSLIPYAHRRNMQIIAFCMGEQGKISRVAAPLLGSIFTFASLERGSESASGQFSIGVMKQLLEILGEKSES
ncbi:MAG: type I 3-dehydroquinate dehydratase [Syntrophobacteraceae bacterium CG23_combo_of_CG06-09_8_20_14_all_50_8]|nr:MAG: type I 3-dehydroquinate dehydratase [Syntrophobacteraceae bacterium CG23_combo_of_CG06-09_8_20_14_all_50_8]